MMRQGWLAGGSGCVPTQIRGNRNIPPEICNRWLKRHTGWLDRRNDDDMRASLRKAVFKAVRLQLNQPVYAEEVFTDDITSLLSGDDLTQLVNTALLEVALGKRFRSCCGIGAVRGKGDDSGAALLSLIEALLVRV